MHSIYLIAIWCHIEFQRVDLSIWIVQLISMIQLIKRLIVIMLIYYTAIHCFMCSAYGKMYCMGWLLCCAILISIALHTFHTAVTFLCCWWIHYLYMNFIDWIAADVALLCVHKPKYYLYIFFLCVVFFHYFRLWTIHERRVVTIQNEIK